MQLQGLASQMCMLVVTNADAAEALVGCVQRMDEQQYQQLQVGQGIHGEHYSVAALPCWCEQ